MMSLQRNLTRLVDRMIHRFLPDEPTPAHPGRAVPVRDDDEITQFSSPPARRRADPASAGPGRS